MSVRKALALLALLACAPLAAASAAFEPEPSCVQRADYSHASERVRVSIDRVEEPELVYFVADIQLASPDGLRTALSHDRTDGALERLSDMARRNGAVLAVNADNYRSNGSGIIIRNGELLRARSSTRALLIADAEGNLSVKAERKGEKPRALAGELLSQGVRQTFEFGPELVRDGQEVEPAKGFRLISTRDTVREPRTAIGQIGPLHYIVIVADGRREGYSLGMTLPDLRRLMVEYGAQTAMNLDGGGSTGLYFAGELINRPSGKRERGLSDILLFR